jgi:hypothetical protein
MVAAWLVRWKCRGGSGAAAPVFAAPELGSLGEGDGIVVHAAQPDPDVRPVLGLRGAPAAVSAAAAAAAAAGSRQRHQPARQPARQPAGLDLDADRLAEDLCGLCFMLFIQL